MSDQRKEPEWPFSHEANQREQVASWVKRTSARDRLEWLEAMLRFMSKTGTPYLERKHALSGNKGNKE